jgi:hypothetical protein
VPGGAEGATPDECLKKARAEFTAVADTLDALKAPAGFGLVDSHLKVCARYLRSAVGSMDSDAQHQARAALDLHVADDELGIANDVLDVSK